MNTPKKEDQLTLELLGAIEEKNDVTQRYLASRLGVALGLANSYLKRCVKKGFVKIHEAPSRRYLYYLTPKGFTEKSRLTASYLMHSFSFYRLAGESCMRSFQQAQENGWEQLLLCGVSELAEIATIKATEAGINIVGVFDPAYPKSRFLGRQAWNQIESADSFQACLVTDLIDTEKTYELMTGHMDTTDKVLVPDIISVSTANYKECT